MRSLLDVNVLLALLDAGHLHHQAAVGWLGANLQGGWASCPLTQNGCLRILSLPSYPNPQPVAVVAERLRWAAADASHEFWADSISLVEEGRVRWNRVLSSRHVTDVYLLALAVERRARLVTFDGGISIDAVPGASRASLVTLG